MLSKLWVTAQRIYVGPFADVVMLFCFVMKSVLQFKEFVRPFLLVICHLSIEYRIVCRIDCTVVETNHFRVEIRPPLEEII